MPHIEEPKVRLGELKPTPRDAVYSVSTIIIGVGIGWFLGFALETTATTVFTSIMAFMTGAAGILAGIGVATERADGVTRADPVMVMLLVIGLVSGSWLSRYAAINLYPRPDATELASLTGLSDKEINARALSKVFPATPAAPPPPSSGKNPATDTAAGSPGIPCATLKPLSGAGLAKEVMKLSDAELRDFLDRKDLDGLKAAVQRRCP